MYEIESNGIELTQKEKDYIDSQVNKMQSDNTKVVKVCVSENKSTKQLDLDYQTLEHKFERIRRITGYLVGTLDRFNDAKKAEERDRVKHSL